MALDSAIRDKNRMNNFFNILHSFIFIFTKKYLKSEIRLFQNIIWNTYTQLLVLKIMIVSKLTLVTFECFFIHLSLTYKINYSQCKLIA